MNIVAIRGVGTGGKQGGQGGRPPKFFKVPFFRQQSALFLREKCRSDCIFCPKGTFENLNLCYLRKIVVIFRLKCDISGKNFGMSGKFFSFLGKNVISPENFLEMTSPTTLTGKIF